MNNNETHNNETYNNEIHEKYTNLISKLRMMPNMPSLGFGDSIDAFANFMRNYFLVELLNIVVTHPNVDMTILADSLLNEIKVSFFGELEGDVLDLQRDILKSKLIDK